MRQLKLRFASASVVLTLLAAVWVGLAADNAIFIVDSTPNRLIVRQGMESPSGPLNCALDLGGLSIGGRTANQGDGQDRCYVAANALPGPSGDGQAGATSSTPSFINYAIPGAAFAAEPTVGVTPSNTIFFQEGSHAWKSPDGGATWTVATTLPPQLGSFDPLLWVDTITGRVYVVHLYVACSQLWYSDDEGAVGSWTYNPLACGTPGNDHQKVATGPFRAPLAGGTPLYENNVIYCYNGLVYGACSTSLDGGLTWTPARQVPCSPIAGHPHIANDGMIYVPKKGCLGSFNGFAFSANNGISWAVRSTSGTGLSQGEGFEPDITTTPDGTIYLSGTVNGPGQQNLPYAFVSTDGGSSWTATNLGASLGIKSSVFPVVTSGDDGHAAVAFHGTTTATNPANAPSSTTWHMYVSVTHDAGATWETVEVSPPGDPTQRGSICLSGVTCGSDRNLLDFIDVTVDVDGNVIVGYADGCVSSACLSSTGTPNDSRSEQGVVAKQVGGTKLK